MRAPAVLVVSAALACAPKPAQIPAADETPSDAARTVVLGGEAPEGFRSVENPNATTARRVLRQLLDRRISAEAAGDRPAVEAVDAEIRAKFERRVAVMVTDMSGFTARTKQIGIIGFLAEVRRLFHLAEPIVWRHKAEWVKVDADDLFIIHGDPRVLFELARELRDSVGTHNTQQADHKVGLAIGLGFGPTLVIEHDIFGDSVNTAAKLGEDVAKAEEILASEDFHGALAPEQAAACAKVEDPGARGSKYPFYSCR